jgi:hypothetical protein
VRGADRQTPAHPLASRLRAYWSEEHGLTALLAVLVAYYLVCPFFSGLAVARLLTAACFTLLAASGVIAIPKRPFLAVAVRVVAVAVLVAAWTDVAGAGRSTMVASCVVDGLLLALILAAVAQQVFQAGPVTAHRIRGAIVVYLLMGALFGILYQLAVMFEPGAIRYAAELDVRDPEVLRAEMSYFSFVTLTTLGYGDVVPVSRVARSLATFEALTGQLFLTITLARLVSGQLAGRGDQSS